MKKSVFINKKLENRTSDCKVQYDLSTVMQRAFALSYVCVLSETAGNKEDEKNIFDMINNIGIKEFFTEDEKEFVYGNRTEHDAIQFNWHYERLAVLLWALGHKVSLNKWDEMADAATLIGIVNNERFVKKSKLLSAKKIAQYEQEANEAYWICQDARVNNRPLFDYTTKNINSEIALERLTAARWLFSAEKTEWDNCSADTYYPYVRK